MDLELAKNLGKAGKYPTNHVRFLWVGAEEEGLLGSHYYVSQLTDAQKLKIIAMLDFDMVASPNYARQVYDGDGSDLHGLGRTGRLGLHRGPVQRLFRTAGIRRTEPIPFDGRSDYVAFTDAGIPAGGIFTGAERIKTPEEQALFGGTAGAAARPLLPPGVRHGEQPQPQGPRRDEGRGGRRRLPALVDPGSDP